ncbi:hypothetical protein HK405_007574, partial [Cladochytrium tenue]
IAYSASCDVFGWGLDPAAFSKKTIYFSLDRPRPSSCRRSRQQVEGLVEQGQGCFGKTTVEIDPTIESKEGKKGKVQFGSVTDGPHAGQAVAVKSLKPTTNERFTDNSLRAHQKLGLLVDVDQERRTMVQQRVNGVAMSAFIRDKVANDPELKRTYQPKKVMNDALNSVHSQDMSHFDLHTGNVVVDANTGELEKVIDLDKAKHHDQMGSVAVAASKKFDAVYAHCDTIGTCLKNGVPYRFRQRASAGLLVAAAAASSATSAAALPAPRTHSSAATPMSPDIVATLDALRMDLDSLRRGLDPNDDAIDDGSGGAGLLRPRSRRQRAPSDLDVLLQSVHDLADDLGVDISPMLAATPAPQDGRPTSPPAEANRTARVPARPSIVVGVRAATPLSVASPQSSSTSSPLSAFFQAQLRTRKRSSLVAPDDMGVSAPESTASLIVAGAATASNGGNSNRSSTQAISLSRLGPSPQPSFLTSSTSASTSPAPRPPPSFPIPPTPPLSSRLRLAPRLTAAPAFAKWRSKKKQHRRQGSTSSASSASLASSPPASGATPSLVSASPLPIDDIDTGDSTEAAAPASPRNPMRLRSATTVLRSISQLRMSSR